MATATADIDAILRANPTLAEAKRVIDAAYDWRRWARPAQLLPEGDWDIWVILTGRGWGKDRTRNEAIRRWVNSGAYKRIHMVARTAADVRDTMIEGESGLLAVCEGDVLNVPKYHPSRRLVTWPNGARALLFSADEPNSLRGPQCDAWAADEVGAWPKADEVWSNLMFGARLGSHVRGIVTTTPRPIKVIRDLVAESRTNCRVIITRGATLENAENLAPDAVKRMREQYEGTRLGRQELGGELLEDNPNALWRREDIDETRIAALFTETVDDGGKKSRTEIPLERIVIGVDPAVAENGGTEDTAETGIIAVGKGRVSNGQPAHFYPLGDFSKRGTPLEWGRAVIAAFHAHKADRIIAEANNGGEMVRHTIHSIDASVPVTLVHASRGKLTRAEPVSALYEQRRVHHTGDPRQYLALEDQMVSWQPGMKSPDRLDALVWAVTGLDTSAVDTEVRSGFSGFGVFGGRR